MATWAKWLIGCGALALLVVVAGVAGFAIWAGRQPREWHVEQSVEISAPPEQIYAALVDLRRWNEWSAWARDSDGDVTRVYTGQGAGSSMTWEPGPAVTTSVGPVSVRVGSDVASEQHGQGTVAIVSADPQTGIEFIVTYRDKLALSAAQERAPTGSSTHLEIDLSGRDFTTKGAIRLAPAGATTRVTWSEDASLGEGVLAGMFAAGGIGFIRMTHEGIARASLEGLEKRMEGAK